MKRCGSGGTGLVRYLRPRSENAGFLAYGRATGVLLITKARSDYRMRVGRQSHLFLMGFETNGRLIKSITYAPEKVRSQSRSLRHLPLRNVSPDWPAAGFFPLYSRVMREGLSTGPGAKMAQSVLSGPIFSGPHDCADLVKFLQVSDIDQLFSTGPSISTPVAFEFWN